MEVIFIKVRKTNISMRNKMGIKYYEKNWSAFEVYQTIHLQFYGFLRDLEFNNAATPERGWLE